MTISVRLNDEETMLFKQYAAMLGVSVSEMVRQSVLERIEDDYDLTCFEEAMNAYRADPETYSLDEAERMLGLR